jgi:hypothetical protein
MINHSPAQLITEIERLMDMDYELLPGARHVLIEAIAYIWPLVAKSDRPIGEVGARLRALIALVGDLEAYGNEESTNALKAKDREQYDFWQGWCASLARLDALLSAPVVNVLRCSRCGGSDVVYCVCGMVSAANGFNLPTQEQIEQWWARQPPDIQQTRGRLSAPVGSPPQEGWAHSLTLDFRRVLSEPEWREVVHAASKLPHVKAIRADAYPASAPRGGGETRPEP